MHIRQLNHHRTIDILDRENKEKCELKIKFEDYERCIAQMTAAIKTGVENWLDTCNLATPG